MKPTDSDESGSPELQFDDWHEAEAWLDTVDLSNDVVVLEDRSTGELTATALLGGGPHTYTAEITFHETGRESTTRMPFGEAADMLAGWTVKERRSV